MAIFPHPNMHKVMLDSVSNPYATARTYVRIVAPSNTEGPLDSDFSTLSGKDFNLRRIPDTNFLFETGLCNRTGKNRSTLKRCNRGFS